MRILTFRLLVIGAAMLAAPITSAPAFAGTEVSPIMLQLTTSARVATVTLRNGDNRPAKFVAEVKERTQADDQSEILADTQDLLINPPIALVPPGKAQLFRVALRHPLPPGAERAYRVIVTDVTPASPDTAASAGGGVSVAVRLSHMIPLYVLTAAGGKPALSIAKCVSPEVGQFCVRVLNTGQVHAQIRSVSFRSGGWSAIAQQRGTVLASGLLRFVVPRPTSLKNTGPFVVTVDVDGQTSPLTATFDGAPN